MKVKRHSAGQKALVLLEMALLLCWVHVSAALAGDHPSREELVWVESDGLRYEIFVSSFAENRWSDPVKVTDDNANNLHPSLAVDHDGKKWLVWTALDDSSISISYSVCEDGVWTDAEPVPVGMKSAITPSVAVDKDNRVWVVWSGNDGGNDEIYYSRYIDGKWEKPKTVNKPNQVPDIQPALFLDDREVLTVQWKGFRGDDYVSLQSTWTGKEWSSETTLDDDSQQQGHGKEAERDEPALPEFASHAEQVFRLVIKDLNP